MALISSKLFARYQRSEKALVLALMEMYVVGVSTRKVSRVTEELCGTSFSKSTISALCKRLDVDLNAWRTRPLSDHAWPYLFVDARYEKVRRASTRREPRCAHRLRRARRRTARDRGRA